MCEQEKKCFKCGEIKPLSEFYRHPKMADGHINKCKECTKTDVKNNREARLEYYLAYDRVRGHTDERKNSKKKETPEKCHWRVSKYEQTYPEKKVAHSMVSSAIRTGRLIKQPCEICGTLENIQAHHEDYAKPLDVRWLCQKHHMELHRKVKEEEDLAILNNTKKGSRYDE